MTLARAGRPARVTVKCTGQCPTFGMCVRALSVAVTPPALALTLSTVAGAVAVVVSVPVPSFPAGGDEAVLEVPVVRVLELVDEPPPQALASSSTPIASTHEQQRRLINTALVSTFAAPAPPPRGLRAASCPRLSPHQPPRGERCSWPRLALLGRRAPSSLARARCSSRIRQSSLRVSSPVRAGSGGPTVEGALIGPCVRESTCVSPSQGPKGPPA